MTRTIHVRPNDELTPPLACGTVPGPGTDETSISPGPLTSIPDSVQQHLVTAARILALGAHRLALRDTALAAGEPAPELTSSSGPPDQPTTSAQPACLPSAAEVA